METRDVDKLQNDEYMIQVLLMETSKNMREEKHHMLMLYNHIGPVGVYIQYVWISLLKKAPIL